MAFTKITQADINNKGVIGLADTPNLSTQAMQEKFDELTLDVLMPKHNELIDELEAGTAASSIGAKKNGVDTTVQDYLDEMSAGGYTKAEADVLLAGKVDKEEGKVLSTNDFTDGFRLKLNGIEDNANNYVLPPATQDTLGGVMGDGTTFTVDENGVGHAVGGGGGGTADYEALINKPKLNDLALIGDKQSEDYGILRPYIKVTSDAGSTVTIKKGAEEITLTQVSGSTTEWEGHPTAYGTWTVKSVLAGADDATTTVTVDAVKTYAVTVNHISATITVTYPNGADCKLSKGALEYTATQNPQTFTVRSVGTWTVTCTYNGIVKTATAIISADGDSQSVTIEYATITVNYGNDFKGKTITCTDGDLTYTKVAPNDASSISFTIPSTGTWAVSATVGGTPYSVSQVVSSYTTYTVTLEVFNATVTITFPYSNGATCTISDGDTTLTATESPMAFTIPNTGTWVATCTLDGQSKTQSFVITTDGQTESHTFEYGTINLTYANEFRGLSISCSSGGTTITKTAPATGNTMVFYPPSTGTWTIEGIYSGVTYYTSATITSLSTAESALLQTIPDGRTVTPTDDIQKWLKCAGINDKNYTTLAEVLADSTTLLALLSDDNAVDYLVRSKTFATASGQVPTMTSDTTPSGTVIASAEYDTTQYYKWKAFNPNEVKGWLNDVNNPYIHNGNYVGYTFPNAVKMLAADITLLYYSAPTVAKGKIQGYDGSIWTDVTDEVTITANSGNTPTRANFSKNIDTYESYRFILTADISSNNTWGIRLQFYATTENAGLCDNSTAMTDIGANDYCAETLLGDATWANAICNSTYFESVLNKKVPTMTSNTTPSGECSASHVASGHQPYLAFDGNNSTYAAITNAVAEYFQYQFMTAVKAFILDYLSPDESVSEWKVQGSNDNSTYTDIPNSAFTMSTTMSRVVMNNDTAYQYYRITVTKKHPSYTGLGANTFQLYGR